MNNNLEYMDELIGLRLEGFFMAKYAIFFCFSGMKEGSYFSYKASTDWHINFDPSDDFTNQTGDAPPNLAKIWTYVEKTLQKFQLSQNGLSCSFYFEDQDQPIVIWKDPNQPGELLIVTDESQSKETWWTI